MKKLIKSIIAIGLILIIYQFIVNFLISKKSYNYSVVTDDGSYTVSEKYTRHDGYNMYKFLIKTDNNTFVYDYEGNLNRQSKIIKNIISYKKDNLHCIAPVFKNNYIENMVCKYNDELVTYTYLKQKNINIDSFINKLNSSNYKVNFDYKEMNIAKTSYHNISYYNDIDSNLYFSIWNYKGLDIIHNTDTKGVNLLQKDVYENESSVLIDKYYLIVDTDKEDNYNSFHLVNLIDGGKDYIESDYEISKNIYLNGVYDKKLYFTDLINEKQYLVDPFKRKISLVEKPKYYDGNKFYDIDITELTKEKKYFNSKKYNSKLVSNYGNNIKEANNSYYFINGNSIYKVVGDNYDYKVKLFDLDGACELRALNNNIYVISGDTVYMYNNKKGLKKVIEDRELIYNHKNIFDVYEK